VALDETIGFLGFGNMGRALLRGLLARRAVTGPQARVFDVDEGCCAEARAMGAGVSASAGSLIAGSTTIIVAVKPQTVAEVLREIPAGGVGGKRFISIAAGVPLAVLQGLLGPEARVIRVMPNTPAMVGAGATAIALGAGCDASDAGVAQAIFEAVGICEVVDEAAMDAVTALSGSGPAYFFYMLECMVKAAVQEGLPEAQATKLAAQTLYGAGKLLVESGEPVASLRQRVTSRGGTTAAALAAFQEHGFAVVMETGVKAAAARSRELGRRDE
jgi:pyrroline-5-carboxylate reductase